MSGEFELRSPGTVRWLLRLLSLVVPRKHRGEWFTSREGNLRSMRILASRGELVGDGSSHLAWWCGEAIASAARVCCGDFRVRQWLRSPGAVFSTEAAALLAISASTRFAATRSLLAAFHHASVPANQNQLVANLFPVVFAAAAGVLVGVGRLALRGRDWRYVTFFLLKTAALSTLAPLLWLEGGRALRHSMPHGMLFVLMGCLLPVILYVAVVCGAVLWSIADQQHRCHVCLHRLILPVRMGSYASIFDPVTVEWLCDQGHGALAESEAENAPAVHWLQL